MNRRRSPSGRVRLEGWLQRKVGEPTAALVGGRARLRVILLLACTLALDSADKAMVGAIAVTLKQAIGISNLQIAMLIAGPTLVTAGATLPFGAITDRLNRTRLLIASIVGWALMMAVGGAATSYLMLLLSRLLLGAVIAAAVPSTASLIGDYFRPGERGRIWGYILAGELAGVAFGYLIAGNLAVLVSWRGSFWALAAFSLILAPLVWRWLPEPTRGGQSQIPRGASGIRAAGKERITAPGWQDTAAEDNESIEAFVAQQGVQPYESLVLHQDPTDLSFRAAVRYILSIRTNVVLIIASALGYLFSAPC